MYYYYVVFTSKGLKYERWFWADSYEDAKVQIQLTYGAGTVFKKIERQNHP